MAFDRTLIQIRERPLLDLLDLGIVVVRHRPGTLLAASLAGIAPFALLNALVFRAESEPNPMAVLMLLAFESPLATAPLTVALGAMMFGQRPRPGRVALTLLRSAFFLLLYQCVLRTVLLFSCVLSPLVPMYLSFQSEVILLERDRWWKVIGRSSALGTDRRGELALLALIELGFGAAFVASAWIGGGSLLRAVLGSTPSWAIPEEFDLADARFQAPFWFATAFFALARFLVYIDQRIRLEGWEVELRLRAVGRSLEEAEPW
ncbi:hypothetical protein TA3x_000680 [Tundrisphaera sp. TA3]|uniref:hypothetical protein n=1 Tax=Tundrisphaera sp. TA3 TaxID=3435775 RepID=UPI003EBEF0CB